MDSTLKLFEKIYLCIVYNKNVSRILAKTFTMKKLLLIAFMFIGLQTFSFSPGNIERTNASYIPRNPGAMTLQNFLTLTPKKYQELTGRKMSFKEKIAFAIFKGKLKRQLPEDKTASHKSNIGLLSLLFGAGAFVIAFIPTVGVISIGLAVAAIVLGIIGLGRKKGDTKSLIGLVLGSVFLLLILVAVAAFASGGWY